MDDIHINTSCAELYSGGGFNYSIPQQHSHHSEDCDYVWKAPNETVLAYGRFLIRDSCVSGFQHIIRCFNPNNVTRYILNVSTSTTSTPDAAKAYESMNTTVAPDHSQTLTNTILYIMIPVLLVAVGVIGFLCYKKRKQLNRWIVGVWERVVGGCHQQTEGNNRSNNPKDDIEVGRTESEAHPLTEINSEGVNPDDVKTNGHVSSDGGEVVVPLREDP